MRRVLCEVNPDLCLTSDLSSSSGEDSETDTISSDRDATSTIDAMDTTSTHEATPTPSMCDLENFSFDFRTQYTIQIEFALAPCIVYCVLCGWLRW